MPASRPWYHDKARLRAAVSEHGSVSAVARHFDLPRPTLAHWAKQHGIRSGHPKTPGALHHAARVDASGHTYVVVGKGTGLYKIGRTTGDPKARLQTMQTGSPVPLELVIVLDHPRWEDVLHHHYAGKRRQGEWFELDARDLRQIRAWVSTSTSG